ncbi:hypothetical protein VQ574_21645 (plasmid) [Stutzerimonas frequens]|uniref:hypothetical protein n=1 Tax=Stutzerimonas frequens TaxID=2968969 RepID=UPI002DBB0FF2|nr:hypothetical protein [Stutzerimonas frequens]WRW29332.1 hypothetical protein VQ574_21645 [Stutzerimonas frequens]
MTMISPATFEQPAWMEPYTSGTKIGRAQALMAYAEYYGVDGSADLDAEIEERLPVLPTPMTSYASRTGTRRNLAAMRAAGWRLLVSAKGVLRTEGMPYALDNGAWTSFQQGTPFDELAFGRAVELLGESADWIVLPDIVAGGMASLEFSLRWLERLKGIPTRLLLAVQNGMEPDDVRELLTPAVGLFVGGDTQWKLATVNTWGQLARRRNCYLHVGRVNSAKRIALCAAAGANSVDGTSASRFEKTLAPLDAALVHSTVTQQDFFNPSHMRLEDIPFDCR